MPEAETIAARAEAIIDNQARLLRQLRSIREASGLTPEDVADRCGCPVEEIVRFERYDSNPTLSELRWYANSIGAVIEYTVITDP